MLSIAMMVAGGLMTFMGYENLPLIPLKRAIPPNLSHGPIFEG
jgi:hypothetical protein